MKYNKSEHTDSVRVLCLGFRFWTYHAAVFVLDELHLRFWYYDDFAISCLG